MGRIPLEVALQGAIGPGPCQLVLGQGKVIHADVDVTGLGQTADGQFQQLQLALGRRHVGRANQPLRAHQFRHVGVTVGGDPVGAQCDDLVQGDTEAVHRLQRQAIDQVDADRLEVRLARGSDQPIDLLFALLAIDRRLYRRIEILHAEAQAIETQPTQRVHLPGADGARVDLNGELVVIAVIQIEGLMQARHQLGQLFVAQVRRCAAPQVQLRECSSAVEQGRLHGDLALEVAQVLHGALGLAGDNLVAGAVVTKALAERNVDVGGQRLGHGQLIAGLHRLPIVVDRKGLMELRRRGIGGVARPRTVIFADQGTIEIKDRHHDRSTLEGMNAPGGSRPVRTPGR
ncbi:hypothetical protein D3C84_535960 [compost metagenome]